MNKKQIYMRDNFLRNLLYKHKGIDNAISTQDIIKELEVYGRPIKERSLPQLIQKLRYKRGVPICYKRGKGYFWAISKNDIDITINDLQNQIYGLQTTINFMNSFILE